MENESPLSFRDLARYRQQLGRFCDSHYESLTKFKSGISFKLTFDEADLGDQARHLSSSATCIESLLDCAPLLAPAIDKDIRTLASNFANSALARNHGEWKSDDSAHIYCRCRTLPLVIHHVTSFNLKLEEHVARVLAQLDKEISRFAIGEASGTEDPKDWYPPNAFHTYWTLSALQSFQERFPDEFARLRHRFKNKRHNIDRVCEEMLLWAKKTAGTQIALHASNSSDLDSDQLAWALISLVKFDRDFQSSIEQQDFIRFGLRCLFDRQTKSGSWLTGAPLFHYRKSGNAYCYVFETFAYLLKNSLTDRKEGIFLRNALFSHAAQLIKLWKYALSVQIPSPDETGAVAWCSGHRANHKEPEGWATASVFLFSQCLRRLMGIWTRETAAAELKVFAGRRPEDEAIKTLQHRGDTWSPPGQAAATQLMTLFVNPTRMSEASRNPLEPDSHSIAENQARAAILFGPPGTSKTTLSRAVADSIGWGYVELHASHFVADGLPNVQRTADQIFEKLMELDRTVILFDEIDELVRSRDVEPDAFGRFLTTSMLPKLAELWKKRKVIYFVATNYIRFFDSAIIRAQRFDALIHVAPPSFEKKMNRLTHLLKTEFESIEFEGFEKIDIEEALSKTPKLSADKTTAQLSEPLARFLLMRWDQLEELACLFIKRFPNETRLKITRKALEQGLAELSDPSLRTCNVFHDYVESGKYEQHDFSKVCSWEVVGTIPINRLGEISKSAGRSWYLSRTGFADLSNLSNHTVRSPGILELHG